MYNVVYIQCSGATVDGRNPANQLKLVVYPIVYSVLYIVTSQVVVWDFFHQQYHQHPDFATIPEILHERHESCSAKNWRVTPCD